MHKLAMTILTAWLLAACLTATLRAADTKSAPPPALKIGDVLPMNSACAQQVSVRLESIPKFNGRPGTIAGQWAVELTQVIMP